MNPYNQFIAIFFRITQQIKMSHMKKVKRTRQISDFNLWLIICNTGLHFVFYAFLRKLFNCVNHPTNFKRHLESRMRKGLLAADDYSLAVLQTGIRTK